MSAFSEDILSYENRLKKYGKLWVAAGLPASDRIKSKSSDHKVV